MAEIRSTRSALRQGRILTEFLLVVLIPSLALSIWGLCDPNIAKSLRPVSPANSLITDPLTDSVRLGDDQVLTVQLSGQMRLWSFSRATQLSELQSNFTAVSCVAYSAKQRLLAVASKTGQLEMWNIDRSDPPLVTNDPDLQHINDCEFTPDGTTLVTAGELGQLIQWDAQTLTRRRTWDSGLATEAIRGLDISADGRTMLGGTFNGVVEVWDLERGERLHRHQVSVPKEHANACIDAVAFVSGEREFVATTRQQGAGIWDVQTGALVREFEGVFRNVKKGTLSPDGRHFVVATMGGEVITWGCATGRQVGTVKQFPTTVKCVLHSADGKILLTGDWNGQVLFHPLHQ